MAQNREVAELERRLIPRKLLFGNPQKASPQISPDGKKLAYLAPNSKGVLNIRVKDLTKSEADRQITFDENRGIQNFFWQLDNEHLLYLQDLNGDENKHLFQTNLINKIVKELTPYPNVKVAIVDYDYKFPDEILIGMNKRDPNLFDVYRLNLTTGDVKLDTENPADYFNWVADHSLKIRVAQSYAKDGSGLIHVRENEQNPWHTLLTIDPSDSVAVLGFTADNRSIYLITNVGANTEQLMEMNLKNGEQKFIFGDPKYDLTSVMTHPTTYALEAVGVERDRHEWIVLEPSLKEDFKFLSEKLKTNFLIVNSDTSNQNWIVASRLDIRPTQFYLYNRPNKQLTFLFSTQPELEKYLLSPVESITFTARDGMEIHAYLTLPVGLPPKNLPTVLYVHGGPWVRDYWGFNPNVQWLANRGYAVLQVNYRGSSGYGKKYLNAGNHEWAGKMQTDLLDGKDLLIKKGYSDPDKIAIFGGSYGGYAVLVGLTFTPDEFCCGVDIVGPSNLLTLLKNFPTYWAPFKAQSNLRLGDLDKDSEELKSRSPLFKADMIKKPLLIAQGANDPRVKQSESDQIVKAMRNKKLPVEYLLFPDEGHGFTKPENRLIFNAAAEEFLAKYLGGSFEPASADENGENLKR